MSTRTRTIRLTGAKAVATPPPTPPKLAPLSARDLAYIAERGVSREFAESEGWHRVGNRIGIPVRDADGDVVNVRLHLPNPKGDIPKTINTRGQGSPTRLAGIHLLADDDAWVTVGGGEFDWAAPASRGMSVVFGSNGEGSVPKLGLDHLAGRRVALALDADAAGRKATKSWVAALAPAVRELRVVSLPEGTDLNDWFKAGRTTEELLELIEASPIHGQTSRRDSTELLRMALDKSEDEGRDNTGLWLACQLRDERYTQDEAWPIVEAYQQAVEDDDDPPYSESAAKVNLEQAWSREPRKPSGKGEDKGAPSLEDGPLAVYVGERFRGQFAYVSQLKDWLENKGTVWKPSSSTAVVEAVRIELKRVFDMELAKSTNLTAITALLKRARIENVAALLKGILEESYGAWDNHPNHLNTPNGVVDLRTGIIEPHSDAYRFTAITRVNYNPKAVSARWTKALKALPEELHDHVQILFGQAITGFPPDHDKVTFLQGGGENGKSSILDGIKLALGSFAGPVPEKVMLAKPGESVPEMMELRGKRLVVLEEMPQGGRLSTKRLKDVAGTATLDGRPLYGKTVVWQATHTMFVTSNHRPPVTETDHGTWRRLQMIVFPYRFVRTATLKRGEKRGDPALRHHFRTVPEEAVLAWLVEGARRWYSLGMRTPDPAPDAIVAATDAWRLLADDVMQFAEEHLVFDKTGVVLANDLWETFDAWAKLHNKQGWSNNTYADRFEEHPMFKDHGVHRSRPRVDSLDVSRPGRSVNGPRFKTPSDDAPLTGKQRIWSGLRWKQNP
ncbi:phage/plasmid primase, P4 family [Microbacterium sp. zg-YB36]|uniref:DNA primase family protein n=1 Tax=Microbacterium sp. zg-YB36 TaxID=2969407 RepID=UPI00214BF9D8|nr:phage/plasmid primase, P4 family [Microbacterium sp. zg-YB36]MDL5351586.1 phage/plasmid primase, P4 family [Microbacterium sp. zg-YB36]